MFKLREIRKKKGKMVVNYYPKRLIVGQELQEDGLWVAIPEKGYKGNRIKVWFNGKFMIIENWLRAEMYRRFPDKWGRGIYTLGYFKWQPTTL